MVLSDIPSGRARVSSLTGKWSNNLSCISSFIIPQHLKDRVRGPKKSLNIKEPVTYSLGGEDAQRVQWKDIKS
jgi:hypothetical protein